MGSLRGRGIEDEGFGGILRTKRRERRRVLGARGGRGEGLNRGRSSALSIAKRKKRRGEERRVVASHGGNKTKRSHNGRAVRIR